MGKVIFILGLCGSGKSRLANEMVGHDPLIYLIDEGFVPGYNEDFDQKYNKLIENLKRGNDCIIIENAYLTEEARSFIKQKIIIVFPQIEFRWKCFENNLEKANINVKLRTERDPEGHIELNSILSAQYTIPKEAEILPIINP